ncbi:hypothetical protein GS982_01800 [Rhodococcus hoagii]|uniref:Uncharacterized protein n=1 Tax=Rhodococcus hoagii TaxID=43767 RepID=A0A9Q4ZIN2_RHOHA|nr:hypothetical protein [Prescottella equi]NKT77334.1 hypothetical protein [Prescottella equi]NKZ81119.1 hypothetical protein [Prescottella equi]
MDASLPAEYLVSTALGEQLFVSGDAVEDESFVTLRGAVFKQEAVDFTLSQLDSLIEALTAAKQNAMRLLD